MNINLMFLDRVRIFMNLFFIGIGALLYNIFFQKEAVVLITKFLKIT